MLLSMQICNGMLQKLRAFSYSTLKNYELDYANLVYINVAMTMILLENFEI